MINETVTFTNYSKEDFTYPFNSISYTFKAGKEVMLEKPIAEHFARHLMDREMQRDGKSVVTPEIKKEYYDKCFVTQEEPVEPKTEVVKSKAKAGRPTKVEAKEFEDLEN